MSNTSVILSPCDHDVILYYPFCFVFYFFCAMTSPRWSGRVPTLKAKIEWFTEIEDTLQGGIMDSWSLRISCCHVISAFLSSCKWETLPPPITLLFPLKRNFNSVVLGGHWKWTRLSPCLGEEIALTRAFRHEAGSEY